MCPAPDPTAPHKHLTDVGVEYLHVNLTLSLLFISRFYSTLSLALVYFLFNYQYNDEEANKHLVQGADCLLAHNSSYIKTDQYWAADAGNCPNSYVNSMCADTARWWEIVRRIWFM